jgi:hypothetical protein
MGKQANRQKVRLIVCKHASGPVQPGRERPGPGARFVIEGRLTGRSRCPQICGRQDFLRKLQWQERHLGSGLQMSPSTAMPLTWHRACSL